MRIQMIGAAVLGAVFCVGAGVAGILSLHAMQAATDPEEIDAARAYMFFWFFLSGISAVLGLLAYRWRHYTY
jgi:hypothetical protein